MSNGMTEVTGGQFLQFVNVLWKVVKKMDATTLENWLKNLDGLFKVLSETLLPPVSDFPRHITMRQGITVKQLIAECKALFPVYVYSGLDGLRSDRTTEEAYTIQVRDRVEADEELKNLSANQLKERNIACITLE